MPNFDLVRDLTMIVALSVGTCIVAAVYAALENVFPFLRGGLGRMH